MKPGAILHAYLTNRPGRAPIFFTSKTLYSNMNQKRLLSALLVLMLPFSGCLSGGIAEDTPTSSIAPVTTHPTPTNMPSCPGDHGHYEVDAEPIDTLTSNNITYRNQSPAARSILKTAVGPGKYIACERTAGFDDLMDRWVTLQQNSDGYHHLTLQYRQQNYCLDIWQLDQNPSQCDEVKS